MITEAKISGIVEEHLKDGPLFLINVEIRSGNRIAVFIDGDEGVSISDCSKLCRHINSLFDRNKEDYELQVSSPGADRPLIKSRQYKRNEGRVLLIKTNDGREIKGKLIHSDQDGITLLTVPAGKKEVPAEVSLQLGEITDSRVVISIN